MGRTFHEYHENWYPTKIKPSTVCTCTTGITQFLIYTSDTELHGISLQPHDTTQVLPLISGIKKAGDVDFHAGRTLYPFYTPVFRRDVLWYGDVRLSVRPSVTVFPIFLLHALRYWAEILCITLFWMHVRSSLNAINFCHFCLSYAPFELQTLTNIQFSALFSYMLWHIELKFCIWLCFTILQIKFECHQLVSIFVGVMPLLEIRIPDIHSFPHFSLPFFDALGRNFIYDFVSLYYRSS